MANVTQSPYQSPRPNAYPLQDRPISSFRKRRVHRSPDSPTTPARRLSERTVLSQTPRYASTTATSSSRKRLRSDQTLISAPQTSINTPRSDSGYSWVGQSLERSLARSDFASPEPFVNTRYHFAGGLDTPAQTRENYFEAQNQVDSGVQRRWKVRQDDAASESTQQPPPLNTSSGTSKQPQSWGSIVFAVAGRMWSFGTSAFRGFYAGGGQGYAINASPDRVRSETDDAMWESVPTLCLRPAGRETTPVPGAYPVDDDDTERSQRPAKRLHVEAAESPWVVVRHPGEGGQDYRKTIHRPPPPERHIANTRRSLVPSSRRSSNNSSSVASVASRRVSEYAHRRSTSDTTPIAKNSPLSPEAQQYLAVKRREERQQDASIRRMNEQLKALLKEGREALGAKVEIIDDHGMDLEDE